MKTTAGFLEKPFGRSRLYILKLYVSLLSTENSKVFEQFAELNTFNILLVYTKMILLKLLYIQTLFNTIFELQDLFFEFAWNNFLHTEVQQCLSLVLNCDHPEVNEIMYFHVSCFDYYLFFYFSGFQEKMDGCIFLMIS